MKFCMLALGFTLLTLLQPTYADVSPFYGLGPDQFVARHWGGQQKFLTTIIAAERDGYLLDYEALSRSLSPWLVGKDSLIEEDSAGVAYKLLIKWLKVKQTDFVRFEMSVNKAVFYDRTERRFVVCLSEWDVFSNQHMKELESMVKFQIDGPMPGGRILSDCNLPVVLGMSETDRLRILSERALEGVRLTRPITLFGKLVGVEPTRSIPSVMGYRWVIGLSAGLEQRLSSANIGP